VSDRLLPRAELLALLDRIDVEGWDGPTGRELLDLVRERVVRWSVSSYRLQGHMAAEAEASAWSAAWESLASPYLRTTDEPMNVLWAVVRRAVAAEVLASKLLCDARESRRLSPLGPRSADGSRGPVVRERPPLSLDRLTQHPDFDLTDDTSMWSSPLLDRFVAAMVEEGWPQPRAAETVQVVASSARSHGYRFTTAAGWRRLAGLLDLPPWQMRRLTILLVGAPGWPGLIERMITHGPQVLDGLGARLAIRSTLDRQLRPPGPGLYLADRDAHELCHAS
jgi:hypothetical protein